MIGSFDESNVIWAVLPSSLKAGDSPDPYYTGQFPVYNGPKASGKVTAEFSDFSQGEGYTDGKIISPSFPGILPVTDSTLELSEDVPWTIYIREYFTEMEIGQHMFLHTIKGSADNSNPYVQIGFVRNAGYYDLYILCWSVDGSKRGNVHTREAGDYINFNDVNTIVFTFDTSLPTTKSRIFINGTEPNYYSNLNYAFTDPASSQMTQARVYGPYWEPDLSPSYSIFWPDEGMYVESFILYDKILSLEEMSTVDSLGSDLGLYGYDNGDGTMELSDSAPTPPTPPTPDISYETQRRDEVYSKLEEVTDVQDNSRIPSKVTTSSKGNVVGEVSDYLT